MHPYEFIHYSESPTACDVIKVEGLLFCP